jgi:hypothetical protein
MSRTALNFWLDSALLGLFLALVFTSVVAQFIFPPGTAAAGWKLWGGGYAQWRDVQFGTLCAFTLAVLLHLMLHWSWVCGVVASTLKRNKKPHLDDGVRTLYGVGALIVILNLLGLAVAAAALAIHGPP